MKAALKSPRIRRLLLLVGLVALTLILSACGGEDLPQNTLSPRSERARNIDGLFKLTLWIAGIIFVAVQGAILVSVWKFRHKKGDPDRPVKQIHGNTKLEIAWTIAPAIILAGIAVPTVQTIFENAEAGVNAMEITVVGHQWWWEYQYTDFTHDDGGTLITANELHIPINTEIALTLVADDSDVIHSFWIPNLSGKRDVVPGHVNTLNISADETGEFYGQCAEFCGLSHANMRLRAIVQTQQDFDAWLAGQSAGPNLAAAEEDSLRAEGWELFISKGCAVCHQLNGTEAAGGGPNPGPNLTHVASRGTFAGAIYDFTTDNLSRWLADPSEMKPMEPDLNRGMPNLGLSDEEITALVAFLEGLT